MQTLFNDKIYEVIGGEFDGVSDEYNIDVQLGKISWKNVNLSKLDLLKEACDTVRKEIKKKNVDLEVIKNAAKKISECMEEEPKFQEIFEFDTFELLCDIEAVMESFRNYSVISEAERMKEIEEKSKTGINVSDYIKQKYIDSGFLPELPKETSFTHDGKTIRCGINVSTYGRIIDTYLEILIAEKFSGYKVTADEYLEQARRFINITKNIFENEKGNFLNYYPFTKDGRFRKTYVVVADSGITRYGNYDYYVDKAEFKLIIESENDNEALIYIPKYRGTYSGTAIYDADNVPSRPVQTRKVYIKPDELQKGHIYIEKVDGTKYVYLGTSESEHKETYYNYLRNTKKLEKLAMECKDIDELVAKMYTEHCKEKYKEYAGSPHFEFKSEEEYIEWCLNHIDYYVFNGASCRINPRKFIADVGVLPFKE